MAKSNLLNVTRGMFEELIGSLRFCDCLNGADRMIHEPDMLTFHTLMMGYTKLKNHVKVIELYDEACERNVKVRTIALKCDHTSLHGMINA
jgi:pentatricopeptide repeat protein